MLRSPYRQRKSWVWAVLTLLVACGGGPETATETPEYRFLVADKARFGWLLPGAFSGRAESTPLRWQFWNEQGPIEGSAWTTSTNLVLRQNETVESGRPLLKTTLDRWEDILAKNAVNALSEGAVFSVVRSWWGRDRLGYPVYTRMFELRLPSVAALRASEVASWVAASLGGRAEGADRGQTATHFRFVVAANVFRDAFGKLIGSETDPTIAAASWTVIPERLEDPEQFDSEAIAYSEVFPLASKFANVQTVRETLARPETDASIVTIVTIDQEVLKETEHPTVQNQLHNALLAAVQPGVNLQVGFLHACDASFVTEGIGSPDFLSSRQSNFETVLRDRIATVLGTDPCDGNEMYRSSILAAKAAGRNFSEADQRWMVYLTHRSDTSKNLAGDGSGDPRVLIEELSALDPRVFLIAPVQKSCSGSLAEAEAGTADAVVGDLQPLSPSLYEYCDPWGEQLGPALEILASSETGLQLSYTPLPHTLTVRNDQDETLPEDPQRGFTYDQEYRTLTPGTLQNLARGDAWTATYKALVEPDAAGIN